MVDAKEEPGGVAEEEESHDGATNPGKVEIHSSPEHDGDDDEEEEDHDEDGHDEGDVDCTDDHDGNNGDNHADHDDNGESANAKSLFGNVHIQMFVYPHPNVNFCQVYLKWYS